MAKSYKWMLRRGGKKERCPQCGRMRFVPYVLASDPSVMAGEIYGRCDREQSCGYFRYPHLDRDEMTSGPLLYTKSEPVEDKREIMRYKPSFEPLRYSNTLYKAFASLLPRQALELACQRYHIGTGSHGECIFYQYDGESVRTGKAIKYGNDGHRMKREDGEALPVYWYHKLQKQEGKELQQCLFGQHLLHLVVDRQHTASARRLQTVTLDHRAQPHIQPHKYNTR